MIDIFLQDIDQPLLLVHAPTGIEYINQINGTNCDQRRKEGYLIPLSTMECEDLIGLTDDKTGQQVQTAAVDAALAKIRLWMREFDDRPKALSFDPSRADEFVEAWIPVLIDGVHKATILASNSD